MRVSPSLLIKVKPLSADKLSALRLPKAAAQQSKPAVTAQKTETVAQYLTRKATESPETWPSNLRIEEHINKKDLYWKVSTVLSLLTLPYPELTPCPPSPTTQVSKEQRDILRKQLREA